MGNYLSQEENLQSAKLNPGSQPTSTHTTQENPQQNLFAFDELSFDSRYEGGNLMYADKVLVLDTLLQDTNASSASETLANIRKSVWAGRLWTIREGALGKHMLFQFKNTVVNFDNILQQILTQPNLPVEESLTCSIGAIFKYVQRPCPQCSSE